MTVSLRSYLGTKPRDVQRAKYKLATESHYWLIGQ